MADVMTRGTLIGLSKTRQSAFGTPKTLVAEFDAAVTRGFSFTPPNITKVYQEQLVGDGNEWANQAPDNDYVTQPKFTYSDRANTSTFAKLLARFLGGTVTAGELPTGTPVAYDQTVDMLTSSSDPQICQSTLAIKHGGIDWLLSDMVANSLTISQQGSAFPECSVELLGSGKFDYMSLQTPALVLPAASAQRYLVGGATVVSFDDGTVLDLASVGRFHSFNFQASNNLVVDDRRLGDAPRTAGDVTSGYQCGRLTLGDQRTLQVSIGVYATSAAKREYLDQLGNTDISNLKIKMVGKVIASTYSDEIELTVMKSTVDTFETQDANGKAIWMLNFKPWYDGSSAGLWKARVRQVAATLS